MLAAIGYRPPAICPQPTDSQATFGGFPCGGLAAGDPPSLPGYDPPTPPVHRLCSLDYPNCSRLPPDCQVAQQPLSQHIGAGKVEPHWMERSCTSSPASAVESSHASECFQIGILDQVIQCLQSKDFTLRCFEQLTHIFTAHTETPPIYASNDLEPALALQATTPADFRQVLNACYLIPGCAIILGDLGLNRCHRGYPSPSLA